jgi:hypothetical protein
MKGNYTENAECAEKRTEEKEINAGKQKREEEKHNQAPFSRLSSP